MNVMRRYLPWTFFLFLSASSLQLKGQPAASPRRVVSLDGAGWNLIGLDPGEGEKLGIPQGGSAKAESTPVSIPNDVQVSVCHDPLGQGSDVWDINKHEWWYVRSFSSPEVLPSQQARLVFDGVDYFADVWLNGEKLGSHEGAYTRFEFDVTKRLHGRAANFLAVRVTSPWKVPGRSHYEFMKGEFEEWWDALPGPGGIVFPLGLHRSVRLEITAGTRLEELQVVTTALRDQEADLKLGLRVSNTGGVRVGTLRLTIRPENFTGSALELPSQPLTFTGQPGEMQDVDLAAKVEQPQLWWTWDLGAQNLYTAEARLEDGKGAVIDQINATFGIRTLERDASMLYKLNGRPIFLRGAWYAMSKLYPATTDRWTYEKDLRLARHANMNHLVNYTVVEKADFYDLADRLGIILFIELPFNQEGPEDAVNKNYPRRDEFIRWSTGEVGQIVRSLANHPSVGVWSALSEVTGNGADFSTHGDFRIAEAADGYKLFAEKMEEVVKRNDPDALYFRSYCDFGEQHFWNGAFFNGTTYDQQFDAQAGFVSEYGALALYPLEDMRRVVNPEDLWSGGAAPYSSLALPINIKNMSYAHPWQYYGMDFLTGTLAANVDRHVRSLRDYVSDSQVYQSFLYGYSADAFRRKLFAPINGIRSWMFKSFPERPVGGFGVIDAFDTPTMGYYAQRRTFAPIEMSYAERYALESVPAGSSWKLPVYISNSTDEELSLMIDSALYNLKGDRVLASQEHATVPARQARDVIDLEWRLPEEPGAYLLRGRATQAGKEVASTQMYLKVAPKPIRKTLRVLVVGTPTWALPVADYLTNLGAAVTPVVYEPTVVRQPEHPFPASAEDLRQNYDAIWLAGFDNYWREAPEQVSQTIVQAVKSGVAFVHTGSWGSFHGGGEHAAALDLTPLAQVLPVEVQHENDVFPQTSYKTGVELNAPPPSWPGSITVADDAPQWLRRVDFTGLAPTGESKDDYGSGPGYHLLNPRPGATVLLRVAGQPLLVSGKFGKGLTLAYLGFSPAGSGKVKDRQPVIVDRAIRSSAEGRLFTIISASLLALATGQDPQVGISDLLAARATPLFETLKNTPQPAWPQVSLEWTQLPEDRAGARVHIQNGPMYVRGLRLRFEGPDFREGNALALWSNQFFDLLPGEEADCTVEIITASDSPWRNVTLEAETLYGSGTKSYVIPLLPPLVGDRAK
jgi:beta-mannosidase